MFRSTKNDSQVGKRDLSPPSLLQSKRTTGAGTSPSSLPVNHLGLRRDFALRILGILCVSAMMGSCSCALSADRQTAQQRPSATAQSARETRTQRAVDPNKFALIVAGVGGEETYKKKFTTQALQLYDVLTNQLGFSDKNVSLLTEVAAMGAEDGSHNSDAPRSKRSTAEEVRNAFASIKSAANADSLVLIVLIGHGS